MTDSLDSFLAEAEKHRIWNHKVSEISHIQNFVKDNEIIEGKATVPVNYIYALYCEQLRPPIPRRRFTMYFRTFFKTYKTCNRIFFRLDSTPFKMPEGYTIWKEITKFKFKYKKTRHYNIKSTPEGWLVYLDLPIGRKIFTFELNEIKAAMLADRAAWFYFGPTYKKFNYPQKSKLIKEDDKLLSLLRLKKDTDDCLKKEAL